MPSGVYKHYKYQGFQRGYGGGGRKKGFSVPEETKGKISMAHMN